MAVYHCIVLPLVPAIAWPSPTSRKTIQQSGGHGGVTGKDSLPVFEGGKAAITFSLPLVPTRASLRSDPKLGNREALPEKGRPVPKSAGRRAG